MITLNKTIFAMPPQIRQKMFSGEYERVGGIIKEKSSGKIIYLLVDKLSEEKDHNSVSVSVPEILNSTLKFLTAGQVRTYIEILNRDLDAQNIQIKPEDLSIIIESTELINMSGLSQEDLERVSENMIKVYTRYRDIFTKYLKDLDRPKDIQSFPFIKITLLVAVIAAKLCKQSNNIPKALEWVRMTYTVIVDAIKAYCLINSKTEKDLDHFTAISRYPASEFFKELREVLASPANKPKYKFPPMEAIYLWNCAEYLEGYQLELESML
ncbi:MAG: hypothetical protein ACOY46_17635 [Bacillota bacterium]